MSELVLELRRPTGAPHIVPLGGDEDRDVHGPREIGGGQHGFELRIEDSKYSLPDLLKC